MKTLHSVIAIGLVGCLLALPLVEAKALQEAQPPAETGISDWDNLRQVRIGDKVEVVRHNLSKHKGKVLAWTEESISLRLKNQDITVPRKDVYRVTLLSKNRRLRNSMIGLGLGALVGAVTGVAVVAALGGSDEIVRIVRFPTFIGAAVGVAVGASSGYRTIYRAPRRKPGDGK